jgi:hypothetical protein
VYTGSEVGKLTALSEELREGHVAMVVDSLEMRLGQQAGAYQPGVEAPEGF